MSWYVYSLMKVNVQSSSKACAKTCCHIQSVKANFDGPGHCQSVSKA